MQNTFCEECSDSEALLSCEECGQVLCAECDLLLHRNGKRKNHLRNDFRMTQMFSDLEFPRLDCVNLKEDLRDLRGVGSVLVFWDLIGFNLNLNFLRETALLIKSRYRLVNKVYVYGEQHYFLFSQLQSPDYEFRLNRNCSEISLLLNDLKSLATPNSKSILITSRGPSYKSDLINLHLPNLKLLKSPSDVTETTPKDLQFHTSNQWHKRTQPGAYNQSRRVVSEKSAEANLILYLKSEAYNGKIMHELQNLKTKFAFDCKISATLAYDLIQTNLRLGKLIQQTKKIGNFDVPIISLKTEKLIHKVLLWVLRSLKNDEMISTEKAIQSRIKEAFDLKLSPQSWSQFIGSCLSTSMHKKALSASFSLFSSQTEKHKKNFLFCSKTVSDMISGTESRVIYPVNEEWVSYDQYIKSGDVFQIKKTIEWTSFVNYFNNLHLDQYSEDQAVSGGRYGCALYLKKYSESLCNCSLGKLSYMVQLAIDEDLLRYHKTLLVWTPAFDKKCKEDTKSLIRIKKVVVNCVASCLDGISLAQLPGLLKDKNLNEAELSSLGFAKLKDLLVEIPDLELALKGKNHPFVRVKKVKKICFDEVLEFVLNKVVDKKPLVDLEMQVLDQFGYALRWTTLGVGNFEEFLSKSKEFVVWGNQFVERRIQEVFSCSTSDDVAAGAGAGAGVDGFADEDLKDDFRIRFIEELLNEDDDKIF